MKRPDVQTDPSFAVAQFIARPTTPRHKGRETNRAPPPARLCFRCLPLKIVLQTCVGRPGVSCPARRRSAHARECPNLITAQRYKSSSPPDRCRRRLPEQPRCWRRWARVCSRSLSSSSSSSSSVVEDASLTENEDEDEDDFHASGRAIVHEQFLQQCSAGVLPAPCRQDVGATFSGATWSRLYGPLRPPPTRRVPSARNRQAHIASPVAPAAERE